MNSVERMPSACEQVDKLSIFDLLTHLQTGMLEAIPGTMSVRDGHGSLPSRFCLKRPETSRLPLYHILSLISYIHAYFFLSQNCSKVM
ncbi:MAG: hypothetical protein ACFFC7_01400 [Candidatus Hermodarchaeota archaeon]